MTGKLVSPEDRKDDWPPAEIDQHLYEDAAGQFVAIAEREWGVALDYSKGSLQALDRLAERVIESRGKEKKALKELMAAYLGETMRRAGGGKWAMHGDFGIGILFPPSNGKESSFVSPGAWVEKRVASGMQDSIAVKGRAILGWSAGKPDSARRGVLRWLRSLFGGSS